MLRDVERGQAARELEVDVCAGLEEFSDGLCTGLDAARCSAVQRRCTVPRVGDALKSRVYSCTLGEQELQLFSAAETGGARQGVG
jgi:hypothetical protein